MTAHGTALHKVLVPEGEGAALVVVSLPPQRLAEEERRPVESTGLAVKVVDRTTYEALLGLAQAGLISMPAGELREVYPVRESEDAESAGRALRARTLAERAERKLEAATLLESGGFAEEARVPATEVARFAAGSLAASMGEAEPEDSEAAAAFLLQREESAGTLPLDAMRLLSGEVPEAGVVAAVRPLLDAARFVP